LRSVLSLSRSHLLPRCPSARTRRRRTAVTMSIPRRELAAGRPDPSRGDVLRRRAFRVHLLAVRLRGAVRRLAIDELRPRGAEADLGAKRLADELTMARVLDRLRKCLRQDLRRVTAL